MGNPHSSLDNRKLDLDPRYRSKLLICYQIYNQLRILHQFYHIVTHSIYLVHNIDHISGNRKPH